MRRREFITLLCGVTAVPRLASAQSTKIARIGFLGASNAKTYAAQLAGFRLGLRDFGYVEGQNINIDFRWADEDYERLAPLAAELVALNVDVIVTHGTPGTSAAKKVTNVIPIVMAVSGDADTAELIQNLSRPGGNVTGLTYFGAEQVAKRLELIKEITPTISRVALLVNPDNPRMAFDVEASKEAARSLHVLVEPFTARSPDDFNSAFTLMTTQGFQAVEIGQDAMLTANAKPIAAAALRQSIISVGEAPFPAAGGLIGFGPNFGEMFRRAAYFVDRLLKGAKAADLPVERPTKFELIINLKTAKALGLTISNQMQLLADEVIE